MSNTDTTPVTFPTGKSTSVTIAVPYSGLCQALQISSQIASQLKAKTITPYTYDGTQAFNPPAGNVELIDSANGAYLTLTTPISTILVTATGHTSIDDQSGVATQNVVAGTGGLNYIANTGSGSIIIGGGDNLIYTPSNTTGSHTIAIGGTGFNDVELQGGNNTVSGSAGANIFDLGTGNNVINSYGNDAVYATTAAATGNDTINAASNANGVYVEAGAHKLTFIGGVGSDTVYGQSGSITVAGGTGGGYFQGGTAGNNVLITGTGQTTLVGGGSGDVLGIVGGNAADVLQAGAGNETLFGGAASGNDTFIAGSGVDSIIGGLGNDTIQAGTGTATEYGSLGNNQFLFVDGSAGGTVTIGDFFLSSGNVVALQGYGANEVQNDLAGATISGGSETITLSDNTHITFTGVTHLTASNFVTM